jgi:histone deacetylase 11
LIPLIYSPKYNISAFGLEHLHPFDSKKYKRIRDWLISQGLRKPGGFVKPPRATLAELLQVHSPEYIRSLKSPRVVARILEVPILRILPGIVIQWRALRPMQWATGGTILACRLALQHGLAINLGGGFHHASNNKGHGFCVYADAPLGLLLLKQKDRVKSVLVVDTDAHQGDGTADIMRDWPWAHILDFYEDDVFPWPKVQEDISVPLSAGSVGAEYLDLLREHLPKALDRYHPDFVVYNAGSDVLATDPLTRLMLTPDDMVDRDLYVVTEMRERGIPLAMVLSGGYGPLSWEAHARSIEAILTRFDKSD